MNVLHRGCVVAENKAYYYSNKRIHFMNTNYQVRVVEFGGKKSVANLGYGQQVND